MKQRCFTCFPLFAVGILFMALFDSTLNVSAFSTSTKPSYRAKSAIRPKMAEEDYSREIRLREEAESPFRKVRFFTYASLGAGAMQSLLVSSARIAAALSGVNTNLLDESLKNAVIDLGGIVVMAILAKRDMEAQESRLKRAKKGGDLARLMIRASKSLAEDASDSDLPGMFFNTNLSSLRRGRGIEKRVVIAAAGKEKVSQILKEAARLQDALTLNDFVIVPVVLPQGIAPTVDESMPFPECVALPLGANWKSVVDDETDEARRQGIDVEGEGIAIVLKKNGRVGQRTKGVFLSQMVGEVEDRRAFGLDVKNI